MSGPGRACVAVTTRRSGTARPAFGPVTLRRGRTAPRSRLPGLPGMMGQHPPDHLLLAGSQVNLRSGQLGMAKDKLDIGQRERGILRHPVSRSVPQGMERGRGPGLLVHPLEHPVDGGVGQRPDRPPQSPPQGLPPPLRDQSVHLNLVEPQPDERVGGGGQLLQLAGALADHRDHLPAGTARRRSPTAVPTPGRR